MSSTNLTSLHQPLRQRRDLGGASRNTKVDSKYTTEVLVVVDKAMRKFHKSLDSDITEYVLTLMSITASVFADASIGNVIDIAVIVVEDIDKDLGVPSLYAGNSFLRQ